MHLSYTDLQLLTAHKGYPCVSILLPTHRTRPDNERDPIVLKNLLAEVENRLKAEDYDKRALAALMDKLQGLADSLDHNHNLDGLALYANADFADFVRVPFTIRARAIIDPNFATRDLISGKLRAKRYLLLVVGEQHNRLYEGYRDTLKPVEGEGFPVNFKGSEVHKNAPMKDSADEDKARRENFNALDKLVTRYNNHERLPIVLAGTIDNLAKYMEVADRPRDFVAQLEGAWDKTSDHDLGKRAWPVAEPALNASDQRLLDELGAAVSAQKYVSTIGEVYRLATERRGEALFVEEGYHQPGIISADGSLTLVDDPAIPEAMDDLVDEIAELVYRYGGHVHFLPDGSLGAHSRIALSLRY
jgi:hypothetical protein